MAYASQIEIGEKRKLDEMEVRMSQSCLGSFDRMYGM